jgi:hypothetical protein
VRITRAWRDRWRRLCGGSDRGFSQQVMAAQPSCGIMFV